MSFDYEKARAGAAVQTRDGHKARILCWDASIVNMECEKFPIIALIEDIYGKGRDDIRSYNKQGLIYYGREDVYDLMMVPTDKTLHKGWTNVYKADRGRYFAGNVYDTEDEARNNNRTPGYLSTQEVTWME